MKNLLLPTLFALLAQTSFGQTPTNFPPKKQAILRSVEKHERELVGLSDQIWSFAEPALMEEKSAKALADYAEKQGFSVQRGVSGMPTAFIASYGSGKPIIGIMGEFDALPGLSQKAVSHPEPLQEGSAGHGCGHNMFGPGSLGAALAVKELIASGQLKGTVRFYGTPAEEAYGGKTYMARDGLFNDLDVCLDWHPDSEMAASTQSSQAMVDFEVRFKGVSAHAAYDPWNGRSALDALELCADGINMLREHVRPTVRMHYVIKKGGEVPNVIPDEAALWVWVRDSKRKGMDEVYQRVLKIAQGAALMADVSHEVKIQAGSYEILVNRTGAQALQKNMEMLGPIQYTEQETAFAKEIQRATGKAEKGLDGTIKPIKDTRLDPEGGSSDVGDVSWIVPEITLLATTAPIETPWHSWPVVACGGMSIGHKGMLFASKALALTMVDLFESEELRQSIRKEFEERRGEERHKAMVPDGPPPMLLKGK